MLVVRRNEGVVVLEFLLDLEFKQLEKFIFKGSFQKVLLKFV